MLDFQKWVVVVTVFVAVLLAMTTLHSSRISGIRATRYLDKEMDRDLPMSLLGGLQDFSFNGFNFSDFSGFNFSGFNFSGFNPFGGGGGNSNPGGSSALKLYWELGYFWQEETIEREWCIACDGGCSEGNKLRTTPCNSTSLPPAQMIINQDIIIPANVPVDLVQIEVAGTGLCMEAVPENDVIFLSSCRNFIQSRNQWFYGYNETHVDRFEIRPFVENDQCVTQLHHPKDGEEIIIQICEKSRIDNTTYWEKYP